MSNRSGLIHNSERENFLRIMVAMYFRPPNVSMHHDTSYFAAEQQRERERFDILFFKFIRVIILAHL